MDPNECLYETIEALWLGLFDRNDDEVDRDDVADKLENLARWVRNGGLYPTVDAIETMSSRVFVIARKTCKPYSADPCDE